MGNPTDKGKQIFFSELNRLSYQNSMNNQVQKILSQAEKDWLIEEQMKK